MINLDKKGGKLYCIKNFCISAFIENKEGKFYEYYSTSDKEDEGFWVESIDGYSATFFDYEKINTHFITYNEWLAREREKQIKSVLDGE